MGGLRGGGGALSHSQKAIEFCSTRHPSTCCGIGTAQSSGARAQQPDDMQTARTEGKKKERKEDRTRKKRERKTRQHAHEQTAHSDERKKHVNRRKGQRKSHRKQHGRGTQEKRGIELTR